MDIHGQVHLSLEGFDRFENLVATRVPEDEKIDVGWRWADAAEIPFGPGPKDAGLVNALQQGEEMTEHRSWSEGLQDKTFEVFDVCGSGSRVEDPTSAGRLHLEDARIHEPFGFAVHRRHRRVQATRQSRDRRLPSEAVEDEDLRQESPLKV